jgi:hypothetical protein
MKKAKSAEMLNERPVPELSPKSMEQKKGGARRPVARKEVPKHLLAQLEGLST